MASDWQYYLSQNPDLVAAGITDEAGALAHWNTYGKNEGRQWSAPNKDALQMPGMLSSSSQPTGGMNINGTFVTDQQIKDFYAKGGDDNQFAQQLGITDPWQRRDLILQARQIAGPGTMGGDAGLQRYFEQYRKYNPNGAHANNFQAWVASQSPHTLSAMLSGMFTGVAASPTDSAPGGIYGPGTGHDFSFEQGRYGMGAHGTGDAWNAWTGKFGETGGTQTSQPMYVDAKGALRYGSPASPPGLMSSMSSGYVNPDKATAASAGLSMTIGGSTYSGDQIRQWLAGKSQAEVKAQAQALGMTPAQVQQALAIGGYGGGAILSNQPTITDEQIVEWWGANKDKPDATQQAQNLMRQYGIGSDRVNAVIDKAYPRIGGWWDNPLQPLFSGSTQAQIDYTNKHAMSRDDFIKKYAIGPGGTFVADDKGGNAASEVAGQSVADYYDKYLAPDAKGDLATRRGGGDNIEFGEFYSMPSFGDKYRDAYPYFDAWDNVNPHPESQDLGGLGEFWRQIGRPVTTAAAMYYGGNALFGDGGLFSSTPSLGTAQSAGLGSEFTAVSSPVVGHTAGVTTTNLAPLGAAGAAGLGAAAGASGTAGTAGAAGSGAAGAGASGLGAAGTARTGLSTSTPSWMNLATTGLTTAAGLLNTQAGKDAASQQADAQIRAAQIAADAAKFRPVGIKTNFGQSQFGYDANGNLVSAGYTLDPLLQAQLGQLAGASGGLMNQFTQSTGDTAAMREAALKAMSLGSGYLGTSPQEQAAKYMADQQGLLAPSRAAEMANLQATMQAQGRGGFAIGGGVGGQGAANPQLQALLNARMQQDAQLAANATQGGMDYSKFGLGMVGSAGDLLSGAYSTQSAALNPYLTALSAAQKIEGLGQNALQMGMDLGGKVTNANAQAGLLTAGGMTNAANITAAQAQQAGSPWASLLQGAGTALSNYKWGT